MNWTNVIMTGVMLVTLITPFLVVYAIKKARVQELQKHRRYQNLIFFLSLGCLFLLEGLIKFSGGSGSLSGNSKYAEEAFFKIILVAHIIGAVLSYLLWFLLILFSNMKYNKSLPGRFSRIHKTLGYITFYGLIYTAVSALIVYVLTLNLV